MSSVDLTRGALTSHLAWLTGPTAAGLIGVMSIGVADAYFIGLLGEQALASAGFIFPVTTALTSLGLGLSAGMNAAVSQALGASDKDRARRLVLHGLLLGLGVATLVSSLGLVGIGPLFSLLQTQSELMPLISAYMSVWYLSFPFMVLLLSCNSTIRAHGNSWAPAALMMLNAAVNIALNPLFIFGWGPIPALGVAGAATATAVSLVLASGVGVWLMWGRFSILAWTRASRAQWLDSCTTIGEVGAPASLANAINPAGLAIVTAIVAQFGPAVVAGFGAAGRIESFALVPLLALSASVGPVVGQNWGGNERHRAASAVRLACGACMIYGLAIALLLTLVADFLAQQFSEEAAVHAEIVRYLQIVAWSFFGYGILVVVNASLNARSKALPSMTLSAFRIACLYLPLSWLGSVYLDQRGVYAAAFVANVIAAAAAYLVARRYQL